MNVDYTKDIYEMLCRKHPNKNIYIIGDHHFYHKSIINYTRNFFEDISTMNEYIITKHNEIVAKDDIVIFLGDFSFRSQFITEIISQMNGYKYLILGNHDSANLMKNFKELGFEGIFNNPVKINNNYLSHEPLNNEDREDLQFQLICKEFSECLDGVNYHGHIHDKDYFISEKYKNVTCEALDYQPFLIGKTKTIMCSNDKPFFTQSPYLEDVLSFLNKKNNICPEILMSDFIYSLVLQQLNDESTHYFVQGSFGLLKKYNYISKFSDLDLTFMYDTALSKNKNSLNFKNIMDELYEFLKKMDEINLTFLKRFPTIRIFEALYSKSSFLYERCIIDANLIFLDCYRSSDFLEYNGKSLIEKFIPKKYSFLQEEYEFPKYKSNLLTINGDITNLLLQIFFQKCSKEKRELLLKKLNYLCKYYLKDTNLPNFSNVFLRFLMRNMAFLRTMNRKDEINYIKDIDLKKSYSEISAFLPCSLQGYLNTLFDSSNYNFWEVYEEIVNTSYSQIFDKCQKLVKKL